VAGLANRGRSLQSGSNGAHLIAFPEFRETSQHGKWKGKVIISQQDFKRFGRQFKSPVWQSPKVYSGDHYIDGLENIGLLTRKRQNYKETAGDFRTVSPRDIWSKVVPPLTSIRFGKADSTLTKLSPRSDLTRTTKDTDRRLYRKSVEEGVKALCRRERSASDLTS
jgi:hypothetical protein